MEKDDDERYETEEILVYVDLDTRLLDDQLSKSKPKIKFLGIDTDNPIMQLNNQLFKGKTISIEKLLQCSISCNLIFFFLFEKFHPGEYEYSMGTHCFFAESKRPGPSEDACFRELPSKMYEHFAKTDKVLKMKRIFVEEKETEASSVLAEGEIEDVEHLRISKTYGEALNQFLKPGEQPPREIPNSPEHHDGDEEEIQLETDEHQMEVEEHQTATERNSLFEVDVDAHSEDTIYDGSEDSENTKMCIETKIETTIQEEFESLINPNYNPI